MSSSFVTRIETEKDEPYTVIFTTDDHGKYRHIEGECRKMIGHAKPTVDAVEVVRCKDCRHRDPEDHKCDCGGIQRQGCHFPVDDDYYCAYGERREEADDER